MRALAISLAAASFGATLCSPVAADSSRPTQLAQVGVSFGYGGYYHRPYWRRQYWGPRAYFGPWPGGVYYYDPPPLPVVVGPPPQPVWTGTSVVWLYPAGGAAQ